MDTLTINNKQNHENITNLTNKSISSDNTNNINIITTNNHIVSNTNDTNNNQSSKRIKIEIRCRAMKHTFGLFDHYFIVIGDTEYHAGNYKPGKILPLGTTKGAHIVSICEICEICHDKIMAEYYTSEDVRIFHIYFPILNCETLCMGFSIQSLLFLTIPFLCVFILKGSFLYAIIFILLSIVIVLAHSKYRFSRTNKTKCEHLLDSDTLSNN
ncbi:putative Ac81-like protein [Esparto virus]|uniref:Putative Ac81-like protein n=1 Tax=Esparto virus TaxID=2072209 RepID=A0A2I7G2Z2_9VIRU|nr:putative Ac81-like protein [Esparto virus]AUQ44008.1 putative Ac81-like protein [Esparto virus]